MEEAEEEEEEEDPDIGEGRLKKTTK